MARKPTVTDPGGDLPVVQLSRYVVATVGVEGGMLLDLRGRGRWYALTPSAARWWSYVHTGLSPASAAEAVARHYTVPATQVRADIAALVADLLDRRILTATTSTKGPRRW